MTRTSNWLDLAARRSTERPWTLGAALDEYCRNEAITRKQLSTFLGCSLDSLASLSLCRKPAPDRFAEDVAKIAARFQVDASKLAQIVRRVDVVAALRQPTISREEEERRLLLAARDRDEEKDK
jgi:hypothetical protein